MFAIEFSTADILFDTDSSITDIFVAVSYTHLDVYKRQLLDKEGINEGTLQKLISSNEPVSIDRLSDRGPKRYNRAGREAYSIRENFKNYFNRQPEAIDFECTE